MPQAQGPRACSSRGSGTPAAYLLTTHRGCARETWGCAAAVSDSCTPSLARLSRLERLCLDTRAVGDAGLRDLAPLTSLRHLDLFGAKITDKGCAFLRCAACTVVPSCQAASACSP